MRMLASFCLGPSVPFASNPSEVSSPSRAFADHVGFTSALIVAWGGVGGILASTLFMDSEAKIGYPTGKSYAHNAKRSTDS